MQSCWNTTRHHISSSFKWFCKIFQQKCSEQTSVPAAIVYSIPSSQRIPWIHCFPVDANVGQFLSLLLAFKNTKTSRHSEIKQTSPSTKQDFSGEALSKQNTEASLASLSWLVPGDDRVVRHICIRCIKDVRANCFCASLLRTQIHMPRHATSYIERAR